jgi:hypothetical protein
MNRTLTRRISSHVRRLALVMISLTALTDSAQSQQCPVNCQPIEILNISGAIDPGDGLFVIQTTNMSWGTATANCVATCEQCVLEYIMTYAMYNAGQFCLTVENEAGAHTFPPSVQNYNRPGVLKANCSPDFAPFFTARAKDCGTGVVAKEITIALDCPCIL